MPSPTTPVLAASPASRFPGWLRVAFWVCIAIAVAVVIRRVVALGWPRPGGPPEMAALDAQFAPRAALTLAHILPAMAFVLLVPLAYTRRFANSPWLDRTLLALGLVVGVTAYAMSGYAIGGWLERSAVLCFNTLFLYCLVRAWQFRRGHPELRLRWKTRATAVLLGIATTRPVMGVFFATRHLTHLTPQQFFGMAFWVGFSTNLILAEWWIRRGRTRTDSGRAGTLSS